MAHIIPVWKQLRGNRNETTVHVVEWGRLDRLTGREFEISRFYIYLGFISLSSSGSSETTFRENLWDTQLTLIKVYIYAHTLNRDISAIHRCGPLFRLLCLQDECWTVS